MASTFHKILGDQGCELPMDEEQKQVMIEKEPNQGQPPFPHTLKSGCVRVTEWMSMQPTASEPHSHGSARYRAVLVPKQTTHHNLDELRAHIDQVRSLLSFRQSHCQYSVLA